jgi:F0F1-type ATP synthase membrane subunit c/vacuolar-type H+-ATPase subunit K
MNDAWLIFSLLMIVPSILLGFMAGKASKRVARDRERRARNLILYGKED